MIKINLTEHIIMLKIEIIEIIDTLFVQNKIKKVKIIQ